MKMSFFAIAATAMAALPLTAHAQCAMHGAEEGAAAGEEAAGPVGAPVGASVGTTEAILGLDERPRFREYVVGEHRPSYWLREDAHVGLVLPEDGVMLYEVPREYHVRPGYRYTVINERPVIVDRRSRRIMEIIE